MSSRVSWFRSILSPNSGDMIIFQSRRSPAFCYPIEDVRQRDAFGLITKNADCVGQSHALTGDVAAVRSPLAGNFVW
jgi:hypothetical protein